MRVAAEDEARFARIVAANTFLDGCLEGFAERGEEAARQGTGVTVVGNRRSLHLWSAQLASAR